MEGAWGSREVQAIPGQEGVEVARSACESAEPVVEVVVPGGLPAPAGFPNLMACRRNEDK